MNTKADLIQKRLSLWSRIVVALMGLVIPDVRWLYDYAWFVGLFVSGAFYFALMQGQRLKPRRFLAAVRCLVERTAVRPKPLSPLSTISGWHSVEEVLLTTKGPLFPTATSLPGTLASPHPA